MDEQVVLSYEKTRCPVSEMEQHSPVSRLPSDVLLDVFFVLRDSIMNESQEIWKFLVITHVCDLWRDVALGCPALWARIESFPITHWALDIVRLFLQRSAQVDIEIKFFIGDRKAAEISSIFENHMWRVREFRIHGYEDGMKSMEASLVKMTHRTRVLEVHNAWDGLIRTPTLSGNYPNSQLDSLTLDCVAIPWTSSIFQSLSSLNLERLMSEKAPYLLQFISLLKSCPNLRNLGLRRVSLYHNDSHSSALEKETLSPNLPHLKSILLHDMYIPECSGLLQVLPVNNVARLNLRFLDFRHYRPTPLHPKIYDVLMRQECKAIDIDFDDSYFSIRPNSVYGSKADKGLAEYDIRISLGTNWYRSQEFMDSIVFVLGHPFWKTAVDVVLTFGNVKPYDSRHGLKADTWGILLKGLPEKTKRLKINFTHEYKHHRESTIGLLEAISSLLHRDESMIDPGMRGLDEITIFCKNISAEDLELEHITPLEHANEHSVYGIGNCKVHIIESEEMQSSSR